MLRLTRILLLAGALASPGLAQFQPRIALCGAAGSATACQWSTVQTTLQATGLFATVDIIDVTTAGGGTPTLGRLMNYDALLCWTNTTPADNNAWGDVLADYVDAGGGVVVAVFANSSLTTGRNIGGRWQNGYEVVLDQSGNASGSGATLGTVLVPTHPVMAGVTAFAGGTTGSRPAGTALEVGATLIAEWSDGKVLVAQGANPSRIDLGFYPPPASCSQSGWSVGGDTLMANALIAVSGMASFGPYGAGCTGSLGVPSWTAQPGSRPSLGNVLLTDISNVPFGIAVVGLGLSAETSGALPLPLDLGSIGMPGCMLLADPIFTDVAFGAAPTVTWLLFVPNNTALIGYKLFGQTFPLDAAVNAFGLTASNGARINVGL